MSSECFWSESLKRIKGKKPSSHVSWSCDERSDNDSHWVGTWNERGMCIPGVRRPFNAYNVVVMASICSMQNEGCKFSNKMVWCHPNLNMSAVCNGNKSNKHILRSGIRRVNPNTYFPSGENLISRTDFWKLKWCRTTPRRALTRRARPSSSTEIKTFPSGLSAITSIFFLFSKGNVKDLLLFSVSMLQFSNTTEGYGLLDEIEDRDSVSNGTIQRISIMCEDKVSLPVHGPKYVRKLERCQLVNKY